MTIADQIRRTLFAMVAHAAAPRDRVRQAEIVEEALRLSARRRAAEAQESRRKDPRASRRPAVR